MSDLQICVAMCTYNGSAFVREQLDSIAAQSRLPDRMVIVDDRSTDSTVSILRSFAAEAPFPVQVVVNEVNLGYAENFDRAIRLCVGDIIVLSDQDDVWVPEKLATLEDAFRKSPGVGMVFSDAELVDSELHPLGCRLWQSICFGSRQQAAFRTGRGFDELLGDYLVTGATMAFRSGYRGLISPIPGGVHHDSWIALLIASVAEVGLIPDPLIRYRQHSNNQIGAKPLSPWELWKRRRAQGRTALEIRYNQLVAARDRLVSLRVITRPQLVALEEAIAHHRVRINLPTARLARLRPISAELLGGRYRGSYSGLRSFLGDLVMV